MATGALLHLPHPRPLLHLAESHYLYRRSALSRPPFLWKLHSTIPSKLGLLQPILRSIQCVKQEEQAGSDGEAVEWVNQAARDPMVELDPVTVFRRIVAERRARASASAAIVRANEEEANRALQTNTSPPFILGYKWPGKSAIAIITALVLLAVAAALYFLRSRKDRDDAMELPSKESSTNGRRKLVKDTIKAPESVITAMALGAASVSRPKVHTGSTHETLHTSNGNAVESQRPEGATDFYPTVNTVAVEEMESDLHGKHTLGQMSGSSSIVEDFSPLKVDNVGVDVTEGPWFGQGVNDTEMLASTEVQEPDSEMLLLAESQKLESENPEELETEDGLFKSQALQLSNETIALPAAEQFPSEISVDEVGFEAASMTDMVYGEFHGKVVAVSEQPNHSNVQVLEFKFGESQIDGVLAESSMTAEKLERIIEEDSITPLEGNGVADDPVCQEQNIVIGSYLSNGQFDETDSESDDGDDDNSKHHGVEQSFTLEHDDGVTFCDSKNGFEGVQVAEGYLSSLISDSVNTEEQENITNLLSGVDQTLEGIETELDDVLDGDSREDNKKALEAAVPALAVGVGTVGALFGVAGGLQVVGFAALASLLSHDFLWAQSRESLWQELNGITDRQKLLDFLAKRNIMRTEQEN